MVTMNKLTAAQIRDLRVLASFIRLFCHARHDRKNVGERNIPEIVRPGRRPEETICPDCAALLEHGMQKRSLCPLEPKPSCKSCHIHCYTPEYRLKIREIMAYSGRRMIMQGRIDYLWHYFINR